MYKNISNSQVFNTYADIYGLSLGIPQVMFNKDSHEAGDTPIINNIDSMISQAQSNTIYLSDGTVKIF